MGTSNRPIRIFLCYAHEDELLLKELEKQLRLLQRQGLIEIWHDREINPGANWTQELKKYLNTSDIILLLVSPDFINSDYCYGVEMQRAMERHLAGEVCVIPVILRPVAWQAAPFGKIQALPTDAKPVTGSGWHSQEEAFYDVAENIRKVVEKLMLGAIHTPSINAVENETKNAQSRVLQPGPGPLSPIRQYGSGLLPINPPVASPLPVIISSQIYQPPQYQRPLAAPSQTYQQSQDQPPFDAITANMKTKAGLVYITFPMIALFAHDLIPVTYLIFSLTTLFTQYSAKQPSRFMRFHTMQSVLLGSFSLLTWACFSLLPPQLLGQSLLDPILTLVAILGLFSFIVWIVVQIVVMVSAFQGRFLKLPFLGIFAAIFAERRKVGWK